MFTDKIIAAIPTNTKFYNTLFSLMNSSIPCNLIVAPSLAETLKKRIESENGETAAYFLTATDFYYADAQTKQPIRIEMNAEQFAKIKLEFGNLKDIKKLEENHFKMIHEITGHQHYNEKAKEKLFELYQVLLNRSRLYEDRHDRHNGVSEFSITLKKQLIAEHLNIIFELISNQLLITRPVPQNISPLTEDNNTNVISTHSKRIETYLNTEALLTDRSKKITSAATLTSEYSKEIDDFFIKKVDDALGLSLPKYELKAQADKIMVNSQERMARTFIRRSIHFIKPEDAKIYHGIFPGTSTVAYFQEIETNTSKNNDETLIALGTTRNAVSNILVTYDFDDNIRREFVAEIRKVLMEGNNPHLKQLYKTNTWEDLKYEWDKDNNNIIINQEIDQYCMKMGVYRDYITLGIGQDLPISMAVIKFFAKHKNLDLYLWEKKENGQEAIVLKEHFPGAAEIETVHLFLNRNLTHVSVLVPREHKKSGEFRLYEIIDSEKIEADSKQNENDDKAIDTKKSAYRQTLHMLAKAHDAFHQRHSGFGELGATEYITDTLRHLKQDLHLHIENASSYSQLFAYLFKSLSNAAQLGNALINRTPIIINQSQEEYIISDRKLSAHMSDVIRETPLQARKELDPDYTYRNSTSYLIERINSFNENTKKQRSPFFMWSIGQINYHLKHIKSKDFYDTNILSLVDELSNYYDLTLYYWDEFEKLHAYDKVETWLEEFSILIVDHKLQEKMNEALRAINKADMFSSYKAKLNKILSPVKYAPAKKILTVNNVDVISSISDINMLLKNAQAHDFNIALLQYIYLSLYHMDVFQDANENAYQWILQLRALIFIVKQFSLAHGATHDEFIDDLSKILLAQIEEKRLPKGLPVVTVNLNMVEIIDLIFKYAYLESTKTKTPNLYVFDAINKGENQQFRLDLFKYHIATRTNNFKKEASKAQDDFYEELVLAYSRFVQQEFYSLPTIKSIALQDELVSFFEQVKKQDYLSENDKAKKLELTLTKLQTFKHATQDLLKTYNTSFDNENNFIKKNQRTKFINKLIDGVNIALLQGMPWNFVLREAYEHQVIPTLAVLHNTSTPIDSTYNSSIITKLKNTYDKIASAESIKILEALINPIYLNIDKAGNTPLSIFLRQVIIDELEKRIINVSNNLEALSDEYLDFLCGLLDGITFEIKLTMVADIMEVATLIDLRSLHATRESLLNIYCCSHKLMLNFKKETHNAAKLLLGDPKHQAAELIDKELSASFERPGQVASDLWIALSANKNVEMKSDQAILELMRTLYLISLKNDGTILLNIFLNNIFIIPEPTRKINGKDISQCYMLDELEQVFLPLHTYNSEGKTLLHMVIDLNLPNMARWLIAMGLSVSFEDKNGDSSLKYTNSKIVDSIYQTTSPIVKEIVSAMLQKQSRPDRDEVSMRLFGVTSQNISFITGVRSIGEYYNDILMPKDSFSIVLTWLINRIARSETTLASREMQNKRILDETVHAILEGFDAEYLEAKLKEIQKEITDQQAMQFMGFITRSRLERLITKHLEKYINALVAIPGKQLKKASALPSATTATTTFSNFTVTKSKEEQAKDAQAIREVEARVEKERTEKEKERTEKEKAKTETQEANKRAEDERTEKEIAKAEARAEKEKLQAENAALKKEMAIGKFHMALPNFDINLKRITADGNCQFSAAQEAYLLVNNNLDGDNAATLRAKVVAYIREHSERFRSFLAQETQAGHEHQDIAYSSIEEYVNNLEKTGTYGDHLSLQALAEIMQRPILVLQPSGNALKPVQVKVIRVEENKKVDINQTLILIFNGRDHYESTKTRGNAEFMRLVYEALPEYHLAATKVQTFFKDYQMRKNRKNEAEATNKTIDVSTLKAEFN